MLVQIDENFNDKIQDLRRVAEDMSLSQSGKEFKDWANFGDRPSGFDYDAVHKEFSRQKLDEEYVKLVNAAPTPPAGNMIILKFQYDFLSALERDFSLRHKSRLRNVAHDVARGHGVYDEKGILQNIIMRYLNGLIQLVDSNTDSGDNSQEQ